MTYASSSFITIVLSWHHGRRWIHRVCFFHLGKMYTSKAGEVCICFRIYAGQKVGCVPVAQPKNCHRSTGERVWEAFRITGRAGRNRCTLLLEKSVKALIRPLGPFGTVGVSVTNWRMEGKLGNIQGFGLIWNTFQCTILWKCLRLENILQHV